MLQSNPAYFQMEKNEEFTLETDKDYTEMGKKLINLQKNILESLKNAFICFLMDIIKLYV